jgi:hypothetical protein
VEAVVLVAVAQAVMEVVEVTVLLLFDTQDLNEHSVEL